MKPQIRDISEIDSDEILQSKSHWAFIDDGVTTIIPAHRLIYGQSSKKVYRLSSGSRTNMTQKFAEVLCQRCYPCRVNYDGEIHPAVWPHKDGEKIIEGFEDYDPDDWAPRQNESDNLWELWNKSGDSVGEAQNKPGHQPAPRAAKNGRYIWVWEPIVCG